MKKIKYQKFVYYFLFMIAFLIPFVKLKAYWLHLITIFGILVILCASLDLLYGYTGLTSLAHGTFFGIGAYSCGILQVKLGISFWSALILATLITGAFTAIIGFPLLRTRGHYFAFGTLALATIITLIIQNWTTLTGGHSLTRIAGPGLINVFGLTIDFRARVAYYYLVLVFIIFTIIILQRLINSRVGRAFIAIREDEELAESIGVNLLGYKLLSFVIASLFAAIAGALYAGYMRAIEPSIASGLWGFNILVMVIAGGPTTIAGYIFGPFLVWLVPEFLGTAAAYRPLIFGLILILIIIFMPRGIAGHIKVVYSAIRRFVKRYENVSIN